jgi:CheY-like chemotaxis protein
LQRIARYEKINILVVEDDISSYLLITEYLMPLGFNLYRTINYLETWDLLNSNCIFNLVLMDIKLPCGITGLDLSRSIKIRFPQLPIMIQTATVDRNRPDSVSGVYDDLITKPYDEECFTGKVLSLVDGVTEHD